MNTSTGTSKSVPKKTVKKAVKKVAKKAVAKKVTVKRVIDPKAATNVAIPDRHQNGTVEGLDLGSDRKIYLTSNKERDDGSRSAAINLGGVTISGKAKSVRGKWIFTKNKELSPKASTAWDERVKKLKDAKTKAKKAAGGSVGKSK
jgi:hypothetical protein